MDFAFHPSDEFDESISDSTVALETAVDALMELAEQGASHSLMATIESLDVAVIDDRYPVSSYTQLPSKTNYQPAMESIVKTIFKAISSKQIFLFAAIAAAIGAVIIILNKILDLFGGDSGASSAAAKSTYESKSHIEDTLKGIQNMAREQQKVFTRISKDTGLSDAAIDETTKHLEELIADGEKRIKEFTNFDFNDESLLTGEPSQKVAKANTELMHWVGTDYLGVFGEESIKKLIESITNHVKVKLDLMKLIAEEVTTDAKKIDVAWIKKSLKRLEDGAKEFPLLDDGWMVRFKKVASDGSRIDNTLKGNEAKLFSERVRKAAKTQAIKPAEEWFGQVLNTDFKTLKKDVKALAETGSNAKKTVDNLTKDIKSFKESSGAVVFDINDKEFSDLYKDWSTKTADYTTGCQNEIMACGNLIGTLGVYCQAVKRGSIATSDYLLWVVPKSLNDQMEVARLTKDDIAYNGIKKAKAEFGSDTVPLTAFLKVVEKEYDASDNSEKGQEARKKAMENALKAGRKAKKSEKK